MKTDFIGMNFDDSPMETIVYEKFIATTKSNGNIEFDDFIDFDEWCENHDANDITSFKAFLKPLIFHILHVYL